MNSPLVETACPAASTMTSFASNPDWLAMLSSKTSPTTIPSSLSSKKRPNLCFFSDPAFVDVTKIASAIESPSSFIRLSDVHALPVFVGIQVKTS